jgi:hypothetical protein
VLIKLQGPIGRLDGVLCVGLDYVESKVPAVKLPPNEVGLDLDGIILNQRNETKDVQWNFVQRIKLNFFLR